MGLGTVYLSLLLLLAVHTANSDYVALAPNNFRPDWEYRVQITVLNTENGNSVTVRGDILNLIGSSVAAGTVSINNGETAQLQIPVGPLSPDQGTQYTLKLAGTGGLRFFNTTTIQLEVQTMVTLLQTDKGIYKPGDMVRFRAVTVDSELKPQKLNRTVTVKNPGGSGLKRYMDDGSKAVFVNTFQLMEFPDMGEWKIEVESKEHNLKTEFPFKVEEYVLPKFEVTAEIYPKFVVVNSGATKATVKVTAKYTYGKGVLGPIEVKIGNKVYRGEITNPKGVGEMIVDIAEKLKNSYSDIDIVVNVTDATKRTYGTSFKLLVKQSAVILEFDKDRSDQVYRPGTPIQVVMKATTVDGRPLSPEGSGNTLKVNMTDSFNKNNFRTETFDLGNGMKYFTWKLDSIMSTTETLSFSAELRYKGKTYRSWHSLQKYKTVGNTTLNARWTSSSMEMWSDAVFAVDVFQAQNFDLSTLRYMVVSRGNVMSNSKANQGNNQVRITPALCPKADIIVYGLTTVTAASSKPEIIADRLKLDLKGCQEKQVMLRGPGTDQRTGSNVTLNLAVSWTEAGKNEIVGEHELFLLAIDKSITLLRDTNPDLTPDKVDMALEKFKLATEDQSGGGPIALERGKRSIWPGPGRGSVPSSTGELFKEVGVKVLRDVDMKEGYRYGGGDGIIMFAAGAGRPMAEAEMASANEDKKVSPPEASVTTTVRKDFPDTWIWTSAKTNNNGQLSMTEKLPDSITSWVVSSFAVRDNTEIAVTAKALEVVAFNLFFLDLNLPYSIRRGEIFTLQVTVFNYESARMEAMVTLTESKEDFKIIGERAEKVEVIPGTGFSVSFKIEATSIKIFNLTVTATGKTVGGQTPARYSDTVIRPLIVKPEGKERMGSETMAVILSADKTFEEKEITFKYSTKEPIVLGSQRAETRITGDMMGNALHDIDKLVSQPTGCGEQNMITTVPNIYAMRYLRAVGETTSKFNRTAKKYMKTGYDRETQEYRFDSGGYSAFGKRDGTQSTWLTAFVVKSFAHAKQYIPEVDEDLLKEDMDYLLNVQTSQGTFTERGRVIHKEMLGGTASQDGTLSVYVTMCLLEASNRGIPVVQERLTRALAFVKGEAKQLIDRAKNGQSKETDMFLASLTAYTLTLSKPVDEAMVMQVMKIVVDSSDSPWKKPAPPSPTPKVMDSHIYPPPKAGASAVETTSYCILTYVGLGRFLEAQNLTKWMTTQQNSFGGYGSTQDTMMALQATSEFAAKSSAFMARSTVTITPLEPPGQPITITVTNSNRRLLQIQELPDTTSKVKVRVEGDPNSLSVVKLNWFYYTNPDQTPKDVTTDTKTKFIGEKEFEFTSCMRLRDGFHHNQMMVMVMEPPTSFMLDNQIEAKNDNPCARRVEVNPDNSVVFYFDQAENCCVKYKMSQQEEVENLKPGTNTLYAYYNADGIWAESNVNVDCVKNCPTGHAAPMASVSGLLLTACICLLLSLIVAM